jgi:hypothetical protein
MSGFSLTTYPAYALERVQFKKPASSLLMCFKGELKESDEG